MTDMENVELAMRKVWQHKIRIPTLSNEQWAILAESATKAMWLIEDGKDSSV